MTLTYIYRFEPYVFVAGLWPPNSSYEQTNIFLLSCSAAVIGVLCFAKGAPYRKPLFTNGTHIIAIRIISSIILPTRFFRYRHHGFLDYCGNCHNRVHDHLWLRGLPGEAKFKNCSYPWVQACPCFHHGSQLFILLHLGGIVHKD
jgi:hypothetical protein